MSGGPKEQKTTTSGKTNTTTSGTTATTGTTDVTGATTSSQDVALPEYLQSLIQGVPGFATTALTDLSGKIGDYEIPPEALQQLQDTLGGDFLYGGQGFNQAVEAAQRAAMPGILSTFGAAGRGTGGLAEHAIAQSGIDAFARLFDSERGRQLQAAQILPQLSMTPINLQNMLLQSASALPGAFSPLFGQRGAGTTDMTTEMEQLQRMQQVQKGKNTNVTSQPVYQPGPVDYALAGVGLLGSFV
jgi:hypothetical protein